jgi:octaprenyl-diphosphate synthase
VADAVKEIIEGELIQIKHSRRLTVTKDEYYEIIRKKTATLISCCSSCGAKSVGMTDEIVEKMQHFGELLGIAFQIKDDLLDYQINSLTGKPTGNDIKERKLTLPLIHALEQAETSERKRILRLLNNSRKNAREFREIIDFVTHNHGLTFAEEKMNEYAFLALKELDQFSNTEIKDSLHEFVEYTILRNK